MLVSYSVVEKFLGMLSCFRRRCCSSCWDEGSYGKTVDVVENFLVRLFFSGKFVKKMQK